MKSLRIPSNDFKLRSRYNIVCSSMWIDFYVGVIHPSIKNIKVRDWYLTMLWNRGLDTECIHKVTYSVIENKHKILYE